MRRRGPLAAVLLVLLAPATAIAADFQKSPRLWATVNVCDTERHPDTLGVRASMPGSRRKGETMWMRFRVQYFSFDRQQWHNFTVTGTDSGYATAPTIRHALSGSSSRVAPAPVFVTFLTGHPKLMSTMSAPASATMRAASAMTVGSEPKI